MQYKASDIFTCKNCGQCCKGYGGTVVTENDIQTIAAYVKEDPERLVDKYCQVSGRKLVLAQGPDDYCIFWDRRCKVHPVKPQMCRAWPFIESVLCDIDNWRIMAASCPGIRIDIPDQLIRARVAEELRRIQSM